VTPTSTCYPSTTCQFQPNELIIINPFHPGYKYCGIHLNNHFKLGQFSLNLPKYFWVLLWLEGCFHKISSMCSGLKFICIQPNVLESQGTESLWLEGCFYKISSKGSGLKFISIQPNVQETTCQHVHAAHADPPSTPFYYFAIHVHVISSYGGGIKN
jgi:hypothetical protein